MRFLDVDSAPPRAGIAELEFLPIKEIPGFRMAHRDGSTIFLPRLDDAKFYPLLGGQQFLYTVPNPNDWRRNLFFGGTDESPFLVELQISALEPLMAGERAFFEGLKPDLIRQQEIRWQTKAKRQGDFFALSRKGKVDWGNFLTGYLGNLKAEIKLVKGIQLRETRHRFSGLFASLIAEGKNRPLLVGEGIIEAPDHGALELKGPHIIEQAVYLIKPAEAD